MSDPMEPVDVHIRADQEVGAALRRVKAAAAAIGWSYQHLSGPIADGTGVRYVAVAHGPVKEWCRSCGAGESPEWVNPSRPTEAETLDALTAELERRSLLEPNRGES